MSICRLLTTNVLVLYVTVLPARAEAQKPSKQIRIPDVAKPGKNGYLKGELIYSLDNKPTPQCHASSTNCLAAAGSPARPPTVCRRRWSFRRRCPCRSTG